MVSKTYTTNEEFPRNPYFFGPKTTDLLTYSSAFQSPVPRTRRREQATTCSHEPHLIELHVSSDALQLCHGFSTLQDHNHNHTISN